MKKITAVRCLDVRPERVCELSVGHRVRRRELPSLALSMQESRSLPIESYDAV